MRNDEKLTPEEALKALAELAEKSDYETAHVAADDVLCALLRFLGHEEVVEAFDKVGKWYA